MSVLDELRKQMHGRRVGSMGALDNFTENTRRKAWEQAIAMLDAFEAEHSGLTDLTGWEVYERKYGDRMESIHAWRRCTEVTP